MLTSSPAPYRAHQSFEFSEDVIQERHVRYLARSQIAAIGNHGAQLFVCGLVNLLKQLTITLALEEYVRPYCFRKRPLTIPLTRLVMSPCTFSRYRLC
jgi:hypothetical protein